MSTPTQLPTTGVLSIPSRNRGAGISTRVDTLTGTEVNDENLKLCATLFSENYGVWAPNVSAPLKPGGRVKMTPAKLRNDFLSNPEDTVLVMYFLKETLVGHAFATKWRYGHENVVGWVTQLVVDANYRKRYIATSLLQNLKYHDWFKGITMMGLVSSHPAACHALCKVFRLTTKDVDLGFISKHAAPVLECTNVKYLKTAEPRGSSFQDVSDGSVSLAYTGFFVDHVEPGEALGQYVAGNKWRLGVLLAGHEFLLVLPVPETEGK